MKDALSYQVQQLLKENKLTIDFDELSFQIQTHPTYPSLHAVTGVLDHFSIENIALDVPKTNETLVQLPNSFLAQIKKGSTKQFVVVTKAKNQYSLIFNKTNKQSVSESEFLEQFTGIVLAVDKAESNFKINNSKSTSNLIKGLTITSVILMILLLINSKAELTNYLFIVLAVFGIYITATILKQEQGKSTMLGSTFCSNPTEKKNCNAVLSSKGATLYKDIKLSDLSFIYFTGLTAATIILTLSNTSIFIPKIISLIALPITLYSIYYQAIVIKKWCFLCLCVVTLMWSQAALSVVKFSPNYQFTPILITMLSLVSIGILWLVISKFQRENKALNTVKLEYFKFKRNFELFNNQFSKSKIINTNLTDTKEMVFGNINSYFHIVMISNPMCGHCKAVHQLVNEILKHYSNSVKLSIRFNVNPKDPLNSAVKVTTRLLEIHHSQNTKMSLQAMNDIYGDYSTEGWLKKWKECSEQKEYLSILQNEYSWCSENNITFTPEILINGQSYPKMYDRRELIHFIEDLIEQFETNNFSTPFVEKHEV
ncbi:MAG: vitamin K epoxide reductase family protein [Winogradskyella sp.]|uniref:vitamin K epoxide reductase family protein n=1 Tax=Winogradskyella sp. TaxID=1883156 RepID=UPI003859D0DA